MVIYGCFNTKLNGQTYPDSILQLKITNRILLDSIVLVEASLVSLNLEKENKKEAFDKFLKKNRKKIQTTEKLAKENESLDAEISELNQLVNTDNAIIESIKKEQDKILSFEVFMKAYTSLLHRKEELKALSLTLTKEVTTEERKLDSLETIRHSLLESRNILFNLPNNKPVAKVNSPAITITNQIENYLRYGPFDCQTNRNFLSQMKRGEKYFDILQNYQSVVREAYLTMRATIALRNPSLAKQIYISQDKSKVNQWKLKYPWIYTQFKEKESELNRGENKKYNPFTKPDCS